MKKRIRNLVEPVLRRVGGFTLVELIVVIAILGILAGVSVPAYNGYIKKADKAADEQLLAAVNKAFASACLENGADTYTLSETPRITLGGAVGAKTVEEVSIYDADFDKYYAGNETEAFKVFTALKFVNGMFVNADGGIYANLNFDSNLLAIVKNSVFMTNPDLGVDNLMDRVDFVTSFAAGVADMAANDGEGNGAWQMLVRYNQDMLDDLGIVMPSDEEYDNMSDEEKAAVMAPLVNLVNDKIALLDSQNGGGIEGWSEMDADEKSAYAQSSILSTYAVLDAAKGMNGQDTETLLTTIGTTSNFKDMLTNSDDEDGVAIAAAAYGLFTAYAYSQGGDAAIAQLDDPIALMKGMDDEGFRTYLGTDQAKADLEAYKAAMQLIDEGAANEEAVHSMMINGFTDPDLLAVINQQMK